MSTQRSRKGQAMTTATVQAAPEIPWEVIAHRAYEIFMARGYEPGHDLDDWLQAEWELREEAQSEGMDVPTEEAPEQAA